MIRGPERLVRTVRAAARPPPPKRDARMRSLTARFGPPPPCGGGRNPHCTTKPCSSPARGRGTAPQAWWRGPRGSAGVAAWPEPLFIPSHTPTDVGVQESARRMGDSLPRAGPRLSLGCAMRGWMEGWSKDYPVPGLDPGSGAACPHGSRCREAPSTKTRSARCRGLPPFRSPSSLRGRKKAKLQAQPISSPDKGVCDQSA